MVDWMEFISRQCIVPLAAKYQKPYTWNAYGFLTNSGRSIRRVGSHSRSVKDLDFLRPSRKKCGKATASASDISESVQEELERLRKENQRLRMERDIY